jgi:hypothetical protein
MFRHKGKGYIFYSKSRTLPFLKNGKVKWKKGKYISHRVKKRADDCFKLYDD